MTGTQVTRDWQDISGGFPWVQISAREHPLHTGGPDRFVELRKRISLEMPPASDAGDPLLVNAIPKSLAVRGGRLWIKTVERSSQQSVVIDLTTSPPTAPPFAPVDSPIFIGDPQAPTPPLGDNDTSIATTAFVQQELKDTLPSVEDWRGTGGDSSDTGTLLNAIAAAKAAGGMQLHVPAQTYALEQTLLIDADHIALIGEGAGFFRATTAATQTSPRTKFLWSGAAGGTIVRFNSPMDLEQRIGGGLRGIQLDGNDFSAARGLHLESWARGMFDDLVVYACSESHIRFSAVDYPLAGSSQGTIRYNQFNHCLATAFGTAGTYLTSTSLGWHLTGGSSVNAGNTCFNSFYDCHSNMSKGIAWKLENTDDNYFHYITGGVQRDAAQYAIELGSWDQDTVGGPAGLKGSARYNSFFGPYGKIIARSSQTGGNPSANNLIYGYSRANGIPRPLIEEPAGGGDIATIVYVDLQGFTRSSVIGLTEKQQFTPGTVAGLSQLFVRSPGAPLEMVDSTGGVRQFLYSTAVEPVVADLSTKSPFLDWVDAPALSLGTSIPHTGGAVDSYFKLVMNAFGGTLLNMAWSGSHARYDVAGSSTDINTIKSLSMTEDDRLAGLALYGPASVYDDSFDAVNKASQMTCDYRIDAKFAVTPFEVVFFDHNHNDRNDLYYGTAGGETIDITAITKGATTQVTLASIGTIAVGNGIVLRVTGIANLDHAAQRVQAVAGNVITINVNSSGYAGTFTAGTCTKYDRATTHGSFRFLYHRIKRAGLLNSIDPVIIYNGAPSDYTNGVHDTEIRQVAELIKGIATEFDCAFFDEAYRLNMTLGWQSTYFADNVHPLLLPQRRSLANIWGEWLAGGATPLAASTAPGTWTPTFSFATPGDSVVTYTTRTGSYLKLGNFVLISMDLAFDLNAYTTASGIADITGLPFVPASPGGSLTVGLLNNVTFTAASQEIKFDCALGISSLRPRYIGSNAVAGNLGISNFPAGKTGIAIRVSGVYYTAS